jgi:CRP-like cAMP-binding protein/Zn-dependent protease
VWRTVEERVDPAKFVPKLADDIEIKHFKTRYGGYTMIANPRDLIHFRIEPGDAELLGLMDGTRTVEEIAIGRLQETGELEISGVADLVVTLYEGNILSRPFVDVDAAVTRALDPRATLGRKLRIFAKTLTFEWAGAQRLVKWLYDHGFRFFMDRWVVVATATISLVGAGMFFDVVHRKVFAFGGSSIALEGLIILALEYLLTFAHELGHALVVVHHGRRIKSAGFMIYFGSPAWFVDSSDSLMMERGSQIVSSFAGPFAQLILAGTASIVVWIFPHMVLGHVLYKFAALNYLLVFLNLIPLLDLDGYQILSDALEMPELRQRSLSFVRHDLVKKVRARARLHLNETGLALYGILGILFSIFSFYTGGLYWKALFGGFVTSLWRGGLSGRIVLAALALFVGAPLIRGGITLARFVIRKVRAIWRQIRFRFETGWRVEAAELIDALSIFDEVPEDVLNELAGMVRLRAVSRGQNVVRQGERADAFYVVRSGLLEVVETDPTTQTESVLRVLGRGESFGELAVVRATVRTASVRALEDSEVFEIDRGTFQRLLAEMTEVPSFAPGFQEIAELRALDSFKHLEPDELGELLQSGEWVTFAPGETIVRQGDVAEDFFTIGSGQVEVMQGRKVLRTLGPNSHFGEIALLLDTERTATVRARTPVRAYRLTRDGFDRLMKKAFKKGTLNPHAVVDRTLQH